MDLNEYKRSFLFKSPSSSSHKLYTQHSKTGNYYIFVIATIQSFTSQILGVVGILGENLDLFSLLGFDVQTNSDHKAPKIKLYSVRALKGYLNEKNLMHGQLMATISKGPVKLIKRVKIAHSFLQSVSDQFHVII